ncbi:uncharacterized protein LOC117121019 [Anneissia japonica]|uniref:uncharacterized protein LOC117121019 n=1 Tax=Anneissia japonica TaxID=1529436 RepID=UPI001425B1F9|nr:uncharacterized protein LOC117121019 [Anneissia japonica]
MRDSFRKNLEKIRKSTRSGAAAVFVKPYKWSKQLQFLIPHLQPRKSYSNIQECSPATEILSKMCNPDEANAQIELYPESNDDDLYDTTEEVIENTGKNEQCN